MLLAKFTLAFSGDNFTGSDLTHASISSSEHHVISLTDFLAVDENDIRSSSEDDSEQDDFTCESSSFVLGLIAKHHSRTGLHPEGKILAANPLFLLYGNFRI